jgi:hypothetical protein
MDQVHYPPETWEWSGKAGHLCVSEFCRYHLATKIGPWWVSTVGEWIPVSEIKSKGEQACKAEDIGFRRLFETMVFVAKECDCGQFNCDGYTMSSGTEVDMAPANTAREARKNHLDMCAKYSRIEEPTPEATE